ncbi:hypothetical protein Tco_0441422, partial [Tanacetum coccineum]
VDPYGFKGYLKMEVKVDPYGFKGYLKMEVKITILKTNTPYPSRRYGVSVPALTKDRRRLKSNTPYPEDSIRDIQDMESI